MTRPIGVLESFDKGTSFDNPISVPLNNKAIFGTLFVLGGLFVLARWWTSAVR